MKRIWKVSLVTLMVLGLNISSVYATSNEVETEFARAGVKDSTLYVKDIKTDSTSVYVAYMLENDDEEKYMYNFSGAGAKVSKTLKNKVTKIKVCLNEWGFDTCGQWEKVSK